MNQDLNGNNYEKVVINHTSKLKKKAGKDQYQVRESKMLMISQSPKFKIKIKEFGENA